MLDVAIVVAFVAWALVSGFRARREASQGLEQYFLAGRDLRGWQAGASMAATQFAADTPLLVAGLVATGGVFLLWRLWIYGLAFLLMGLVLGRCWRRAGVITDAELTELRYGGRAAVWLRGLKAVYYGALVNGVVLAMVLTAAVRIAEVFLPWHRWLPGSVYEPWREAVGWTGLTLASATGLDPATATADSVLSIVLIVAFTALYSTTGGLRAVVRTDVMQLGIALVGTFGYAAVVAWEVGGIGAIPERMAALYGPERASALLSFAPPADEALMPFLVVIGLQWVFQMNADGTGYLAQRTMACRTDDDARFAAIVFAWLQILLRSLPWLVIAVGLLILHPYGPEAASAEGFVAGRELLYAQGVEELLPVGLRGLVLTGLLAALASTVDTHLNWGASYFARDLYERLLCHGALGREPSRRELVWVARASIVVILGIAFVILANLGSIQTAWFVSLMLGAGMGGVLLLRWLWERITVWSEIAAIAVSLALAPVLLLTTETEEVRLVAMAAASTTAVVLAALLGPRTPPAVLRAFYRQVRPPGLWGETAVAVGDAAAEPRRALVDGLASTGLVAASLFLCLYGAGRLLIAAPDAGTAMPAVALAVGIALIPAWVVRVRAPGAAAEPASAG